MNEVRNPLQNSSWNNVEFDVGMNFPVGLFINLHVYLMRQYFSSVLEIIFNSGV